MTTTTYKLGNIRQLGITFYSDAAKTTPADPTAIVFKLISPGETAATSYTYGTDAEVVKTGTGVYYFNLTLATDGDYKYSWNGTGAVTYADDGNVYGKDLKA